MGARISQSTPKKAPVDSGIDLTVRKAKIAPVWITKCLCCKGSRLRFLKVLISDTHPKRIAAKKGIVPASPVWTSACITELCI